MTRDGEGRRYRAPGDNAAEDEIDTTAASAFPIVVLLLGQRHCIGGAAAIHLPVLMKANILVISDLPALPFYLLTPMQSLAIESQQNRNSRKERKGASLTLPRSAPENILRYRRERAARRPPCRLALKIDAGSLSGCAAVIDDQSHYARFPVVVVMID